MFKDLIGGFAEGVGVVGISAEGDGTQGSGFRWVCGEKDWRATGRGPDFYMPGAGGADGGDVAAIGAQCDGDYAMA